jgi:hypothetical protein
LEEAAAILAPRSTAHNPLPARDETAMSRRLSAMNPLERAMSIDSAREAAGDTAWTRAAIAGELPALDPGDLIRVIVLAPGLRMRLPVRPAMAEPEAVQ